MCVYFCLGHLNVLHLCFGMAWCVLLLLYRSGIDLYADMTWCLALLHVFYDLFVFVFVAFASDFIECVSILRVWLQSILTGNLHD